MRHRRAIVASLIGMQSTCTCGELHPCLRNPGRGAPTRFVPDLPAEPAEGSGAVEVRLQVHAASGAVALSDQRAW